MMGLDTSQERLHRLAMVEEQLRLRGICNEEVLLAMEEVPRHLFIPETSRQNAYADRPCPIGFGQTISQPYMVATMTEQLALQPDHQVLEIGTGCGYQSAILAHLSQQVCTIEVIPELSRKAQQVLSDLDISNIRFHVGDGHHGWPQPAAFDRIIITAAAAEVPPKVFEQLADGGLLMAPIGEHADHHRLMLYEKRGQRIEQICLCYCTFVPLEKTQEPGV